MIADQAIRELYRERQWSRLHLVPLLLAEQDRDAYRRHAAAVAREKSIMSDVDGWEVGLCSSLGRALEVFGSELWVAGGMAWGCVGAARPS